MGTLTVFPLDSLVQSLGDWLALPKQSRWLIQTIPIIYVIQFARRPPGFSGSLFTLVANKDIHVLHAEIVDLLAKDEIQPVPPANMKSGFYSPYFIVPKKSGELRLILDLQVLNQALHKLPFKIVMQKHIPSYTYTVLSRLDFTSTQTVSSFLQGSDIPVQGPPLQVFPVSPYLCQGCGALALLGKVVILILYKLMSLL